jgi:hypothetical protein
MKLRLSSAVAGAATLVTAAGIVLAGGVVARAATTPPYEPDPQSVGTVTLFNSSGSVISSGSINTSPIAAYAVGSAVITAGDNTANLIAAQPNPNAATSAWNTDFLGGFTSYPLTTGPSNIQAISQTHPVVTGASSDLSLSNFIAEFPNDPAHDSNTSYQNLYQLRLETAKGSTTNVNSYDVLDVLVSGTTWTQVYPTPDRPPVAVADSATTTKNKAIAINVLKNDSDPDGNLDPTSLAIVTAPTHGGAAVLTNHTIGYKPKSGFVGTDSLTYRICDTDGACAGARVTIKVNS